MLTTWSFKCSSGNQYLFSNLDEQDEYDDHEQVVNNAQSSNYDVDDLEHKVTNVGNFICHIVRCRQRRRDVAPNIARQRRVLHRCWQAQKLLALYQLLLLLLLQQGRRYRLV